MDTIKINDSLSKEIKDIKKEPNGILELKNKTKGFFSSNHWIGSVTE